MCKLKNINGNFFSLYHSSKLFYSKSLIKTKYLLFVFLPMLYSEVCSKIFLMVKKIHLVKHFQSIGVDSRFADCFLSQTKLPLSKMIWRFYILWRFSVISYWSNFFNLVEVACVQTINDVKSLKTTEHIGILNKNSLFPGQLYSKYKRM